MRKIIVWAVMAAVAVVQIPVQAAEPAPKDAQAAKIRKAQEAMRELAYARGWKATIKPIVRLVDGEGMPEIVNARLEDTIGQDGNVITAWDTYDDGDPSTWEGYTWYTDGTYTGAFAQQIRFDEDQIRPNVDAGYFSGDGIELVYNQRVYFEQTGPQPTGGTAVKRVSPYPDFYNYYKCALQGCGIAGILGIILAFTPVGAFAQTFFTGCTGAMLTCAFGRLWEWNTTPAQPPHSHWF